jgi:hypothetical protein
MVERSGVQKMADRPTARSRAEDQPCDPTPVDEGLGLHSMGAATLGEILGFFMPWEVLRLQVGDHGHTINGKSVQS